MIEPFLTEGARRALELAGRLARREGADRIEPRHLLWALWHEESRAAEIMAESGLSAEILETHCPLESEKKSEEKGTGTVEGPVSTDQAEEPVPYSSPLTTHHSPAEADQSHPPPDSEIVRQVLHEARRQVGLLGRHAEVGSEHLLWGLSCVESPAADVLRRHGLEPGRLADSVVEKSGLSSEPLGVDVRLDLPKTIEADRTDTLRVLDAAANRAREGLRVLEDFVRFSLDDPHLTGLLKTCRHDLTQALRQAGADRLLAARDTRRDVGTAIRTAAETLRSSPLDVVQASFKRVQEAARTLEEFGKVLAPELGEAVGQLRYRLYTLEKAVLLTHVNRRRLEGRDLYLLVTEDLCHHGSGPAIRESLAAGAGIVQVREKAMPDRRLIEHARRVREWTREAGALLIINDRPDLAVLAEADGVHVGQDELPVREARRIVGPDRLIGVSTHTIEQARQAVLDGADYLGVGPVFPSTTKAFDEFAGLEFVRQATAEISLPWFAIGGIGEDNVAQVVDAGAARIAVSSAICGAESPGLAARRLRERLRVSPGTSIPATDDLHGKTMT